MHIRFAVAATIAVTSVASIALADTYVAHEKAATATNDDDRYREGIEVAGYAGVGYGVGVGGRVGVTLPPEIYLGGAFTYYSGNAAFLGGEVGYKFWPGYRWELRPYLFMGPAFLRVGDQGFGRRPDQANVVLAFQPGFLGAYHFGPAYILAEGRVYVSPSPGALAFLGGVGVNL
jgi:hypothetical protein